MSNLTPEQREARERAIAEIILIKNNPDLTPEQRYNRVNEIVDARLRIRETTEARIRRIHEILKSKQINNHFD